MTLPQTICALVPELKPSHLFWVGDKMFISYFNDKGKWVTKPAMRDPNYSGFRYVANDPVGKD